MEEELWLLRCAVKLALNGCEAQAWELDRRVDSGQKWTKVDRSALDWNGRRSEFGSGRLWAAATQLPLHTKYIQRMYVQYIYTYSQLFSPCPIIPL